MLSREGCIARKTRLWSELPETVQWVLIADPRHVTYFSGFWINPVSSSGGERAFLFLSRQGESVLITDNFSISAAGSEYYVDKNLTATWYDKIHQVKNRDHILFDIIGDLPIAGRERDGLLEEEWFPRGAGNLAEQSATVSLGSIIRNLRRMKEKDEIDLMKRIMEAADAGHKTARKVIKPGISEMEVYLDVQRSALEALNFPGIVYGDFRAVNREHPKQGGMPTGYVLKEGDLFILDYSIQLGGYRSDNTNTIAVGEPGRDQQKLFNDCVTALEAGETGLKAGTMVRDIFKAAEDTFLQEGYDPSPPRHMGHGLGLGHPEPPIIVRQSSDILLSGDVVTLEPAQYIRGIGGVRVEHNYEITESGYRRLSGHQLKLAAAGT